MPSKKHPPKEKAKETKEEMNRDLLPKDVLQYMAKNFFTQQDLSSAAQVSKLWNEWLAGEENKELYKNAPVAFDFTKVSNIESRKYPKSELKTLTPISLQLTPLCRIINHPNDRKMLKIMRREKIEDEEYACSQELKGHMDVVTNACALPDGKLMTTSEDKSIRIWSDEDNMFECQQVLEGHTKRVAQAIPVPQGIISCSGDKTLKLWEQKEQGYVCTQTLVGHDDYVAAATMLPNGNLATISEDGQVKIWHYQDDIKKYEAKQSFQVDQGMGRLLTIVALPGNGIACGSAKGHIQLFMPDNNDKYLPVNLTNARGKPLNQTFGYIHKMKLDEKTGKLHVYGNEIYVLKFAQMKPALDQTRKKGPDKSKRCIIS